MYKRLYKEANDSIPLNSELKEKLIKEARAENEKNKFGYLYRYGAMAAALVIAVGIFNLLPKTQKSDTSPNLAEVIVEENQPMPRMTRGIPETVSEDSKGTPPAFSPADELDYADWILPGGMAVISQSENSVAFSDGDMKLTVTLMPYRGLLDTEGMIEGERIDENSVMVKEGENEYSVYLMRGDRDYKISSKNISEKDLKIFVNSIK